MCSSNILSSLLFPNSTILPIFSWKWLKYFSLIKSKNSSFMFASFSMKFLIGCYCVSWVTSPFINVQILYLRPRHRRLNYFHNILCSFSSRYWVRIMDNRSWGSRWLCEVRNIMRSIDDIVYLDMTQELWQHFAMSFGTSKAPNFLVDNLWGSRNLEYAFSNDVSHFVGIRFVLEARSFTHTELLSLIRRWT